MWAFARLLSWREGDIAKGHVLKSTEEQKSARSSVPHLEQGELEA